MIHTILDHGLKPNQVQITGEEFRRRGIENSLGFFRRSHDLMSNLVEAYPVEPIEPHRQAEVQPRFPARFEEAAESAHDHVLARADHTHACGYRSHAGDQRHQSKQSAPAHGFDLTRTADVVAELESFRAGSEGASSIG